MAFGSQPWMYASGEAYTIDNSLRFDDGDSAYLSWTPSSAGDRKTWTVSFWMKRGKLTTGFYPAIFSADIGGHRSGIRFEGDANDRLSFWEGNSSWMLTTTRIFRDPSAWYHIVGKFDSTPATPSSSSIALYINGEQVTGFDTENYPAQDFETAINDDVSHSIGREDDAAARYFDGYLAEVHFIDGTALDASSFGETDTATNQWKPIKYTGSYGTNGFYLDFADSAALGDDESGNNNDFAVTNLVATDQMPDTPTNNYCTGNPLNKTNTGWGAGSFLAEGNLTLDTRGQTSVTSTFAVSSGKWYWECLVKTVSWWPVLGFCKTTANLGVSNSNPPGWVADSWGYQTDSGEFYGGGSLLDTYTSVVAGDIMQFALDMDAGEAWVGINDTWVNSGDPATGTNAIVTSGLTGDITPVLADSGGPWARLVANFGQDSSFAGAETAQGNQDSNSIGDFYYEPPSGYLTLCSSNLSSASADTFSYVGNGNADGPFVYMGYAPSSITISAVTYNIPTDGNPSDSLDWLANGVKIRSSSVRNTSTTTYDITSAPIEQDFKYSNAR